jgi:arsenite-transporting ATPase
VFLGGKGGVGKTTCAVRHAARAARAGSRVLVISTDPAHSLGDALGVRLTSRATRVPLPRPGTTTSMRTATALRRRRGALHAAELDAGRAFARWLQTHRRALGDVIEHGTWLDRGDVDALLSLSLPGLDELVGLLEIARLAAAGGAFDLVVVDTAPTGHTLRLIGAPAAVGAMAGVLDALQEQHRMIRHRLARAVRPEAADRLIALIAAQARSTGDVLHDPSRTSFIWVTLPEELSVAESEDAIRALDASGVRVDRIIVNRVLPEGRPCPRCDGRRTEERRMIARIRRTVGRRRRLDFVAETAPQARASSAMRGGRAASMPPTRADGRCVDRLGAVRLLFFGGKGGVGKTTVAAAAALVLARHDRLRRIAVISMDPAHSLGDVLRTRLGDRPSQVRGAPRNFSARELDPAAALAARQATLEKAVDAIETTFGAGSLTVEGVRGVGELMRLAPPGIDELFGLIELARLATGVDDQLFVVDTAPTGHALRLLEMPAIAREWLQVLLRVLLKYRELVRPGELAAELLDLSHSIRALQELLRDRARTMFVVVTRAAALPRLETERLLARLRTLNVGVPAMVLNALIFDAGSCPRCRLVARAERREAAALAAACGRRRARCAIIRTPFETPPPRGVPALERWAENWVG